MPPPSPPPRVERPARNRAAAAARRSPGRPPALEELEDRLAPAGYSVSAALEVSRADDLGGDGGRQVVFFESSVADFQALRQGLGAGTDAVVLDAAGDGLREMAAYLEGRRGLAAVHLVAHGRPGAVELGAAELDGGSLGAHAADLAAVGAALAPGGELDLWSCDVAAGARGRALLRKLAAATGVPVAAAGHEVGAAGLGGSWGLDATVGAARATVPFSAAAREWFAGVLDAFQGAQDMSTPRDHYTATLLGDGKVLVAGGKNGSTFLDSAELYDPALNLWSPAGTMSAARASHTATKLGNGKVLVAGGASDGGTTLDSAELYDPASNTWSPAGTMSAARQEHTATPLPGGQVLVAGGDSAGTSELYDPGTNTWSTARAMTAPRFLHTATPLPGGKVLVAGGFNGGGALAGAQLYDPGTNTWSDASSMSAARQEHTATPLPGGKVLVAGGTPDGMASLAGAELYDSTTDTWSPARAMRAARFGHTATPVGGGKVLVSGGDDGMGPLSSAELYDAASNLWSPAGTMSAARYSHTATLLAGGEVLVAGGFNGGIALSGAELYGATTTTGLSASPSPSTYGEAVTLTATVSNTSGDQTPAGAVEFFEDYGHSTTDLGPGTPLGGSGASATSTFATSTLAAGNHSLRAVYRPAASFIGSAGTATQMVNRAALTIAATNQGKTYGDAFTFAGTEFTATGLVNGDRVASATFASAGAAAAATYTSPGPDYAITPSAAVFGRGSASNYVIGYANGTLHVNPRALTVTANDQNKTYGDTFAFAGTEFTTSGLANGDAVTSATLASAGVAATAAVADYAITASAAVGSGLGNYAIGYAAGTLHVTRRALTVTAINQGKTYGNTFAFAGTEFTTSGLANGDTVTSATLTSAGAAATATYTSPGPDYAITPSAAVFGAGSAGNYAISYVNGTLSLTRRALTVTATNQNKTYGDTFAFAGTEFTTSGLVNGDAVTSATLTSAGAAAAATYTSPGPDYAITPSAAAGSGVGNYAISYVNGTLSLTRRALTVTATNQGKTYGDTFVFAGTEFTTSGLANGDAVTSATLAGAGAAAAATYTSPGPDYAIAASAAVGSGLGNYAITYAGGNLHVNRRTLIITANDQSKTYGDTFAFAGTEFTTNPGGLVNGNTVTSATLASAGAAAAATVTSPGPDYAIAASAAVGSGLGNYAISYADGNLHINRRALTITATNQGKIYGDTFNFAGTEFTTNPGGLVNGDAVTSVTFASPGAAATATYTAPGPDYAITASAAAGSGLGNYAIGYGTGTLHVNQRVLTVTPNNQGKIYGDAFPFAGTEFTTNPGGLVNGDTVTSVTLASAGAAAAATVTAPGPDYAITASAAVGSGLGNYAIGYAAGNLHVIPRALTVTPNDQGKTYGNTFAFAGTEFTTSGLANGDRVTSVTLASAGAAAAATYTSPGPDYPITASAAVGSGLGNYAITYDQGTMHLNPRALIITPNNQSKTYGDTFIFNGTEFTTNAGGLVNGDRVASATLDSLGAPATAKVSGSPYPITASAAVGTGLGNYDISYAEGTLRVTSKALTITADPRTKTYGDEVTFEGTEFTTVGLVNGDAVTSVTLTSPGAAMTATVASSPYAITPSDAVGTGLDDYSITYVNGNLTVDRKALTVTANDQSKTYGNAFTFAGTEFTTDDGGLVNGDTVTSATLASAGAAAAATVTSPGPDYAITASAAVGSGLGNYAITYAYGNLHITRRALTVTANNQGKTYGNTFAFAGTEFTATGLANGDTVTRVTLSSAGAAAAATFTSPGPDYPITPSGAVFGAGSAGNYDIRYADGTLSLTRRALTVTANNQGKTYGNTFAFAGTEFTATGLANGDTVTRVTLASAGAAAAALVAGSPYRIAASAAVGTGLGNYVLTYADGNLTVNRKVLTVTADDKTKVHLQPNPALTYTYSGFVLGEGPSVLSGTPMLSTTATAGSPLGSYTITVAQGTLTAANYSFRFVAGTLYVSPASLVVAVVSGLTAPAGSQVTVTVTAYDDAYGNVATGYRGTVRFGSSDRRAGLPADYTFQAADQGVRTFVVTLITAGAQAVTATDVAGGLAGRAGVTVTPLAAASFDVVAVGATRAGDQLSVTVTARDRYGNAATGYRGTVRLGSSDGRAGLPADYAFQAADQAVRTFAATLYTAGAQAVTATDVAGGLAGRAGVTVTPLAAASFDVVAVGATRAGDQLSVTVTARDRYGNAATGYRGTVRLGSSDGRAGLPADYAFQAADQAVRTFAATLYTAGAQAVTATDVAGGLAGRAGVTVTPLAAASFDVAPGTTTAGDRLSVTVTARDRYGNAATAYQGTVRLASTDRRAAPPADYAFPAASRGTQTFAVTLYTAGNQTVTATDLAGNITGAGSVTVTALAEAASFDVVAAGTTRAGDRLSVTVTARDRYGNAATGYQGTVHFTSTDRQAAPPADYRFPAASAGTQTFTIALYTAGAQTVTATDVPGNGTGSATVTVTALAEAASFDVVAPGTTRAGDRLSVTVTARDRFRNVATGYQGTVHFTSSDRQAAPPADYRFPAASAGTQTFTIALYTAGAQTVTATDVPGNGAGSATVTVTALAEAASFDVVAPGTTRAGDRLSVTVTARDRFRNVATGYQGTVHFTSSDRQAAPPADYRFPAGSGGTQTLMVALDTAGAQTVTATDVPGNGAGSATVTVKALAEAASFDVVAPGTTTVGDRFSVTVTARDRYRNVATDYQGTVHLASTDRRAALPADSTFPAGSGGAQTFTVTLNTAGAQRVSATDVPGNGTGSVDLAVTPSTPAPLPPRLLPSPTPQQPGRSERPGPGGDPGTDPGTPSGGGGGGSSLPARPLPKAAGEASPAAPGLAAVPSATAAPTLRPPAGYAGVNAPGGNSTGSLPLPAEQRGSSSAAGTAGGGIERPLVVLGADLAPAGLSPSLMPPEDRSFRVVDLVGSLATGGLPVPKLTSQKGGSAVAAVPTVGLGERPAEGATADPAQLEARPWVKFVVGLDDTLHRRPALAEGGTAAADGADLDPETAVAAEDLWQRAWRAGPGLVVTSLLFAAGVYRASWRDQSEEDELGQPPALPGAE